MGTFHVPIVPIVLFLASTMQFLRLFFGMMVVHISLLVGGLHTPDDRSIDAEKSCRSKPWRLFTRGDVRCTGEIFRDAYAQEAVVMTFYGFLFVKPKDTQTFMIIDGFG
jgi:hypothetical protein